jgi:threonylcarbamoyladenosine tRNA methylthiotransferase MtaB
MRRTYDPGYYSELVSRLHAHFPQAAIGADVIVGFPGESEKQFENSLEFIQNLPVSYLHVFPFSPRPGVPAADFKGRVQGEELKRRAACLQRLGGQKKRAFRESLIGQSLEVLAESEVSSGLWEGLSDNYVKVFFYPKEDFNPKLPALVKVDGFQAEDLMGTLVAQGA